MNSPSSHKSYRPFTVLSLRLGYFIANVLRMNGLFVQRVLNVTLHAVLVQMVGRLYQCLFPIASADANTKNAFLLKAHTLASILFMLHPTHIESVVNVANRAHLLSLLLVMLSLDLSLHAILGGMIYTMGLLACETTIFLFPAICLTWIYMDYTASDHDADNGNDNGNGSDGSNHWKILHFIRKRLWRIVLFSVITFVYISMRYYFDWIVIPQGLIRPAENPFYALGGMDRVLNYSYVMSIHVVKSIGMGFVDLVGFSHEYGFDCVKRIDSLYDGRLLYPLILGALIFWLIAVSSRQGGDVRVDNLKLFSEKRILFLLTTGAWMASLFPISGMLRVGTFIADRIVISSTVASAILWTRVLYPHLNPSYGGNKDKRISTRCPERAVIMKLFVAFLLSTFLWIKIQRRSVEWMCPVSLLRGSLRACPRCAKSHLEMGKVYGSGLLGETKDLEQSLYHLQMAEEIDPDFCDVNHQLAQVYIQNGNFLKFEDRLTKGVLCQFTMNASYSIFQQYWSHVLNDPSQVNTGAKKRYDVQLKTIQDAIARETEIEGAINVDASKENLYESKQTLEL